MIILTFPDTLQEQVFDIIDVPENPDDTILTIKVRKEISEQNLAILEALGVKILKPVKNETSNSNNI